MKARNIAFQALAASTIATGVGSAVLLAVVVHDLVNAQPRHVSSPESVVVLPTVSVGKLDELRSVLPTIPVELVQRVSRSAEGVGMPVTLDCVSTGFFQLLGVSLESGVDSTPRGDVVVGDEAAVVLSHEWWNRLGRPPPGPGATVFVAGSVRRIIGVAPDGFSGIAPDPPDGWLQIERDSACADHRPIEATRARVVGRVPSDMPSEAVERTVRAAYATLTPAVGEPSERLVWTVPDARARLLPKEVLVAQWASAGAFVLLLVAAANVCGLFAIRIGRARRELTVRRLLGASARHVVVETARTAWLVPVLALPIGGAVASGVGAVVRAYHPFAAASGIGLWVWAAIVVCTLVAFFAAVTLPLVVYLRDVRLRHVAGQHLRPLRLPLTFAAVQVAASLVLIVVTLLMVRSSFLLWSEAGFDVSDVWSVSVERLPSDAPWDGPDLLERWHEVAQRSPEVVASAVSTGDLLRTLQSDVAVLVQSDDGAVPGRLLPILHAVSHGYFDTVGTDLVLGRPFTSTDIAESEPVAIVDERSAREMFSDESPVGQCVRVGRYPACVTIVGVAEARRHQAFVATRFEVFVPLSQRSLYTGSQPRTLLLRFNPATRGAPRAFFDVMGQETPGMTLSATMQPLAAIAEQQSRSFGLATRLFWFMGLGGVLMSIVGLYAGTAAAVASRSTEIGIRKALGATSASIVIYVLSLAVNVSWKGAAAGLLTLALASAWLTPLLFEISAFDPISVVAGVGVTVAAVLAGSSGPCRRATQVPPAVILRDD